MPGSAGGITIKSDISHSNVVDSAVLVGMNNALDGFRGSGASAELKDAIELLNGEAKKLMERVDEPTAKEVGTHVQLLTGQAGESDPIQDLVKVAARGIISIGERIDGMSAPVAQAARTVLSLLKIAI